MAFSSDPAPLTETTGLVAATWRYRTLTVILACLGALAGIIFTFLSPRLYTAQAASTLRDPASPGVSDGPGMSATEIQRYVADQAAFATSAPVLDVASATLNADPAAKSGGPWNASDLRDRCDVTPVDDRSAVLTSCRADSGKAAVLAVTALVDAYSTKSKESIAATADKELATLEAERTELESQLDGAPSGGVTNARAERLVQVNQQIAETKYSTEVLGDGVNFVDPARLVPTAGFIAQLVRNTVVGFVLGLLPALLIAWIRADRAPIVQRPDEFADLLRMPHLATVPAYENRDMYDVLDSDRPEIQQLVSNVSSVMSSGVLLVVEPVPISGHVELVVKTAAGLAQTGKRVLLIDADPSEQLTRFLGLNESFGLSDLLSGFRAEGARMASISFGRIPGLGEATLRMMGAGTRRPQIGALARTPQAAEVFEDLRAHNDYVIVALPPLNVSASSTSLGRIADGMVVSVERGTEVAAIEATRQQLEFFGARGLGFVVIDD